MRIYLYPEKTYAVSVIIPMYNAKKYIGECLDSLLLQTFTDFEVIVVDDCSTDNSVNIVEDYAPKFNGRLKLTKTEKNSGGGGYVPRNMGLKLARGEYVFFLDSDDFLLLTGLDTLYMVAEKFNADVMYMASHYRLDRPNALYVSRDAIEKDLEKKNLEDKLTFMGDDTNKIVHDYLHMRGNHAPWAVFVKRDFLTENKIFFPEEIYNGGDGIWNLHIRCLSKRFLRNSIPVYFQRCYGLETITRKRRPLSEQVTHKIRAFSLWIKSLWRLSKKLDFLKENPVYVYDAFKIELGWMLNGLSGYSEQLNDREIYAIVYNELSKENSSLNWMEPFFFTSVNLGRKTNDYYSNIVNAFKRYFTARLDIKLVTKDEGNFQIVFTSDKNASVSKPAWAQYDGIGYQIQSYVGNLEIIAKATASGKINLRLRGIDIRNPEDKSKRIPYWIDYTKLTVNGKNIFDKLTPAWHDKPYIYTFDVKADEEIKIETEWLPHRSDVPAVATPKEELPPKKIEAPKVAPPPKKVVEPIVKKVVESVDKKLLPYFTARVDVNLVTAAGGDFQVVSVSDDNAVVRKSNWLPKNEIGYVIQSHKGNMAIVAKATTEGKLTLSLRSMDVRNPKDNTRIPYWIDYTRLTVNAEKLFDEVTPVWHDKPYKFTLNVKAGDEIKIETEWQPHKSDT